MNECPDCRESIADCACPGRWVRPDDDSAPDDDCPYCGHFVDGCRACLPCSDCGARARICDCWVDGPTHAPLLREVDLAKLAAAVKAADAASTDTAIAELVYAARVLIYLHA